MNVMTTCDEVRTPNFFRIYESSTFTTTDEGTKAGKIIRGTVEETLKDARREYRFRDETERKLRRLQERLKYDFLHTHMPFVRAMAFFSNEFYKIVKQWNPKPFEKIAMALSNQESTQYISTQIDEFQAGLGIGRIIRSVSKMIFSLSMEQVRFGRKTLALSIFYLIINYKEPWAPVVARDRSPHWVQLLN